jgi:hypothetical protein
VLEDALAGLAEDDDAMRSTVLSHLAWCAPYCFDRDKTHELGSQALFHARAARSKPALITALRTQIHFGSGPCQPESEIKRMLEEADQLAAQESHALRVTWSNQASAFRAVFALQRGDRAGIERALDTMERTAKELQHAELIWHSERMRVVDRMNRGELLDAPQALRELRARAKSRQLFAHELVCSNDFLVLRRQTMDLTDPAIVLSSHAQPAPQDSPGVLAIKLRATVDMGRVDVAQTVFAEFVQRGFERLPCDRDYLGVLGHLARAAILLEERGRAQVLFTLLEPHAALFASDISFHSDGAVAHVVGLLARYLEQRSVAVAQFQAAVTHNDRMGMRARATESRLELASTLLTGTAQERAAAGELLGSVQSAARTLGMVPLFARATTLLDEAGLGRSRPQPAR